LNNHDGPAEVKRCDRSGVPAVEGQEPGQGFPAEDEGGECQCKAASAMRSIRMHRKRGPSACAEQDQDAGLPIGPSDPFRPAHLLYQSASVTC